MQCGKYIAAFGYQLDWDPLAFVPLWRVVFSVTSTQFGTISITGKHSKRTFREQWGHWKSFTRNETSKHFIQVKSISNSFVRRFEGPYFFRRARRPNQAWILKRRYNAGTYSLLVPVLSHRSRNGSVSLAGSLFFANAKRSVSKFKYASRNSSVARTAGLY